MSTSEAKGGVKGSYGAVTESKSVVEISSFKIIKEESRIINNNEIYFAMEVEVELIKPNTKLDEHFNVSLDVNKVDFFEHEKIELSIKSNQTGYLTLLMESENGYYVLFPNSLERNNKIEANSTFTFPPSINNYMSITASLNGEDDEETTQIIAVVTKSDVPLSVSPKMKIHDNRLKIKEVSEMEMIKWKLDIPLSTRSQDERLITVRRKRKDNKVYDSTNHLLSGENVDVVMYSLGLGVGGVFNLPYVIETSSKQGNYEINTKTNVGFGSGVRAPIAFLSAELWFPNMWFGGFNPGASNAFFGFVSKFGYSWLTNGIWLSLAARVLWAEIGVSYSQGNSNLMVGIGIPIGTNLVFWGDKQTAANIIKSYKIHDDERNLAVSAVNENSELPKSQTNKAVLSGSASISYASEGGFIAPGETANVTVSIRNIGKEEAKKISLLVLPNLDFEIANDKVEIGEIEPNDVRVVGFELKAKKGLKTKRSLVEFKTSGVAGEMIKISLNVNVRNPSAFSPMLVGSLKLLEPSGNKIIDSNEEGVVELLILNKGKGEAIGIKAAAILEKSIQGLELGTPTPNEIPLLLPYASAKISIPVKGHRELTDESTIIRVSVVESNGFATERPIELVLKTKYSTLPKIKIESVHLLHDVNNNGVLDKGEEVGVFFRLKNSGDVIARNVEVRLQFGENCFFSNGKGGSNSFILENINPRETKEMEIGMFSNSKASNIKLGISVFLENEISDRKDVQFEFGEKIGYYALNKPVNSTMFNKGGYIEKKPELDNVPVDIEINIPISKKKNPNAVAIVIGINKYKKRGIPEVAYAKRDALLVREYLKKTFGLDEENILPKDNEEDITAGEFKTLIKDRAKDYLSQNGSSDLIVYYSGHGSPRIYDKKAFLIPYDCDPNYPNESNAYSVDELYADIRNLNARNKLVIIDACFTGQTPSGDFLVKEASAIIPEIKISNPLFGEANALVVQSTEGNTVANWYSEKKYSLFTYFFLKGLQGAADKNADKMITGDEIENYVNSEEGMLRMSRRQGRIQKAQVNGNKALVITEVK
ncbi:hypothetical protein CHS0354_000490 [Potamilus streckersoni]|uniref:Uncharacterized protein n=1 Tax=Potamilus streckersoni TaxID=2493646 RepID=A0AAE0W7D0_9BIVA|nr:hypothetical protein CHS0354_000490 [Potamilus streckersoni]